MNNSNIKLRRSTNNTATNNQRYSISESITSWHTFHETYINPFAHRLNIDSRLEYVKIYILTVLIVPLRVTGVFLTLLMAWIFASIGMYGCTPEQINEEPLTGWRKNLQRISEVCMRAMYASGSFHWVTFKGKQATAKEAPILVVAPHSSYVDSIIVPTIGPPAIVAKRETIDIPLLGKVISFSQPIFVQREDPNSRQNTVREINNRASSGGKWPQIAIFAEGTCTNRKALIKFKPGAFYAGVPVQPVLLKYPNKYDTLTWTWEGPGALHLIWLTMARFYTNCEIEFLPVYVPNEQEKTDPNLYAHNVRAVMARALDVPTSEYSFEDVVMMDRARNMKIPFSGDIIEIERILFYKDYLDTDSLEELLTKYIDVQNRFKMDIWTFAGFLNIDVKDSDFQILFHILDQHHVGYINLRHFLLCAIFCEYKSSETMVILRAIKNLYAKSHYLTNQEFTRIVKHAENLTTEKINELFAAIDGTNLDHITFEDFEEYVRDRAEYKFLYKKHLHIRRHFKK